MDLRYEERICRGCAGNLPWAARSQ